MNKEEILDIQGAAIGSQATAIRLLHAEIADIRRENKYLINDIHEVHGKAINDLYDKINNLSGENKELKKLITQNTAMHDADLALFKQIVTATNQDYAAHNKRTDGDIAAINKQIDKLFSTISIMRGNRMADLKDAAINAASYSLDMNALCKRMDGVDDKLNSLASETRDVVNELTDGVQEGINAINDKLGSIELMVISTAIATGGLAQSPKEPAKPLETVSWKDAMAALDAGFSVRRVGWTSGEYAGMLSVLGGKPDYYFFFKKNIVALQVSMKEMTATDWVIISPVAG